MFRKLLLVALTTLALRADSVLVLPFFNYAKSANLDWIGESIAETIHDALMSEGILALERITIDDSLQIRLGAEYSMPVWSGRLLSVRGGFWHDPVHLPYYRVDDEATGYPAPMWALLFPKRDGDSHVAGGIGFSTYRHLQFDVAFDHSKSVGTIAASVIYRF